MNETECKLPPDQVKFPLGFFFRRSQRLFKSERLCFDVRRLGSARLGASRQID
jgi:hypothetical protein